MCALAQLTGLAPPNLKFMGIKFALKACKQEESMTDIQVLTDIQVDLKALQVLKF